MGNCIRKESSSQWGGDDWGSFNDDKITTMHDDHDQNSIHTFLEDQKSSHSHDHFGEGSDSTEMMKIKVSKKQLEQILKYADVEGMSMDQVFSHLTHTGAGVPSTAPEPHQPPWTPALQTIPE